MDTDWYKATEEFGVTIQVRVGRRGQGARRYESETFQSETVKRNSTQELPAGHKDIWSSI